MAQNVLREVGIEFTNGDSYDFAWIGQASFMNKKISLKQSVEDGLEFLNKITGDYMLFDGQDAATLIGSYEVLKESKAIYLMKNTLYRDWNDYKKKSPNGRTYWGEGKYSIPDIDEHKHRIKLSGTNWLSTLHPKWYNDIPKTSDVSALFGGKHTKEVHEHDMLQSKEYDDHRELLQQKLKEISSKYKIEALQNGQRYSQQEYYERMVSCKVILAPFGYGEMAPRDLESAMFGSVLLKPNMSHLQSIPNIYVENETYIPCKWDYSDIYEKVEYILTNYDELRPYLVNNMRKKYEEEYSPEKLVLHLYELFKNLEVVRCE